MSLSRTVHLPNFIPLRFYVILLLAICVNSVSGQSLPSGENAVGGLLYFTAKLLLVQFYFPCTHRFEEKGRQVSFRHSNQRRRNNRRWLARTITRYPTRHGRGVKYRPFALASAKQERGENDEAFHSFSHSLSSSSLSRFTF